MYISYLTQDRAFNCPLNVSGEFANGDLSVLSTCGKLRIPRFLVTTPIQVCEQCYRPMVMRKVTGQGILVQCPDHALHQATGHFQLAINPELSRSERRSHARQAKLYRRETLRG